MFRRLEGESSQLLNTVIELTYFMRGAISYDDMMRRTYHEREMIAKFIKNRLQEEEKKMVPVY